MLRIRALLPSLLLACGATSDAAPQAQPTPAAPTAPAAPATPTSPNPHGTPPLPDIPEHDTAAMAVEDMTPRTITREGTMSAKLNGRAQDFLFLPPGSNAAIANGERGVARIMIGGAPTDSGRPMLRIVLEGARLDRLKLPATFSVPTEVHTKRTELGPPPLRMEYELAERKIWIAQPGATVVLESFDGTRLAGRFHGTLAARSAVMGPPITIEDGRFDIAVRLSGIEAKPSATPIR